MSTDAEFLRNVAKGSLGYPDSDFVDRLESIAQRLEIETPPSKQLENTIEKLLTDDVGRISLDAGRSDKDLNLVALWLLQRRLANVSTMMSISSMANLLPGILSGFTKNKG